MAITTTSGIPDKVTAGDAYTFTESISEYSASSGWRAVIHLTSPEGSLRERVESATTSGTVYTFALGSAVTSKFTRPGVWTYALTVTDEDDGDRITVSRGVVTVMEDFAADNLEPSHARKCVELLEAKISGRIIADSESVSYLGVNVNQITSDQLHKLLDRYRSELARELDLTRARSGLRSRGFTSRINLRG